MNKYTDIEQLRIDILDFIEKYAIISPNYDGVCDDEKYTAPDTYQLLEFVYRIDNDLTLTYPWSSWESGAYKNYSDKIGRELHDSLLFRINQIISK